MKEHLTLSCDPHPPLRGTLSRETGEELTQMAADTDTNTNEFLMPNIKICACTSLEAEGAALIFLVT
jgi:hypothetical protein